MMAHIVVVSNTDSYGAILMYAVLMLPSGVLITNHFVLMYIVHVHVWCTYLYDIHNYSVA